MRIAIVSAGIARLTRAKALQSSGRRVVLLQKSRSLGGRMATRRVPLAAGVTAFDNGAQYCAARSAFQRGDGGLSYDKSRRALVRHS